MRLSRNPCSSCFSALVSGETLAQSSATEGIGAGWSSLREWIVKESRCDELLQPTGRGARPPYRAIAREQRRGERATKSPP